MRFAKLLLKLSIDLIIFLPMVAVAVISRFSTRPIDIGLGPEPLISYIYHKKALAGFGYSSETYVADSNFITSDFDYNIAQVLKGPLYFVRWYYLFFRSLFRYRCLYFSFHGGPLMGTLLLRKFEPLLLNLAGIKVVILPYGSDVQDMSRCQNLSFTDAMAKDYPLNRLNRKRVSRQIDLWTCNADHIVSGCDWVDYMYHWDTLQLAHFSIDSEQILPVTTPPRESATLRILHAPNHRNIKGTEYFVRAVKELRDEGVDVELILLERVSNEDVKREIANADVIADQLIIGWYAMFAIEAMAMGKPVLCYLREDLKSLYILKGLIKEGELPIIECNSGNVKEEIRSLIGRKKEFDTIGIKSREFVQNHHSVEYIGSVFNNINKQIGVLPLYASS